MNQRVSVQRYCDVAAPVVGVIDKVLLVYIRTSVVDHLFQY